MLVMDLLLLDFWWQSHTPSTTSTSSKRDTDPSSQERKDSAIGALDPSIPSPPPSTPTLSSPSTSNNTHRHPNSGPLTKQISRVQERELYVPATTASIQQNFAPLKVLDIAGQSSVFLARYRRNNTAYVVKCFKPNWTRSYDAELTAFRALGYHKRIARCFPEFCSVETGGIIRRLGRANLVLEYYQGGDLFGVWERSADAKEQVPEGVLWVWLKQMSEALAWIHGGMARLPGNRRAGTTLVHRDIKLENWLVEVDWSEVSSSASASSGASSSSQDRNGISNRYPALNLRLADFGLAVLDPLPQTTNKAPSTFVGSGTYLPPEVLQQVQRNKAKEKEKKKSSSSDCSKKDTMSTPKPDDEIHQHQLLKTNSRPGDIWALGSCIQILCTHTWNIVPPPHPLQGRAWTSYSTSAPRLVHDLSDPNSHGWGAELANDGFRDVRPYSRELEEVVARCLVGEPEGRVGAEGLVAEVERGMRDREGWDWGRCPRWCYANGVLGEEGMEG